MQNTATARIGVGRAEPDPPLGVSGEDSITGYYTRSEVMRIVLTVVEVARKQCEVVFVSEVSEVQ